VLSLRLFIALSKVLPIETVSTVQGMGTYRSGVQRVVAVAITTYIGIGLYAAAILLVVLMVVRMRMKPSGQPMKPVKLG
jgi:hypothetical protein